MLVGLRQPSSVVTFAMPDEHPLGPKGQSRHSVAKLTLRQADQASPEGETGRNAAKLADFATIESNLEFIMGQLARVPTRKKLARYSLLVMVGTACLVQTLAFLFR